MTNLIQKTVGFVSLGCDKNRVDLEYMINDLIKHGFKIVSDELAQIVIINSCGFIKEARDEAIDITKDVALRKKEGTLEKIIISGCIPNCEDFEDLKGNFSDVDAFVKIEDQKNIVEVICGLYDCKFSHHAGIRERTLTTVGTVAYLKICDGCNNFCSYCRIPLIRGRFYSREKADILKEAKDLVGGGIRELILIGQDITAYGKDLKKKTNLAALIRELAKIKELVWIRLLYCYPETINSELLEVIKNEPKVCKYIDIPLQHVSTSILKSMNRRVDKTRICLLLNKFLTEIPDIAVRTTFIVGFPGETKAQFKELLDFVQTVGFAYVGVFAYSKEEGTIAARLDDQLSENVKARRKSILEKAAKSANAKYFNKLHGKQLLAVCSNKISENLYEFRTQFNAPEIDQPVFIEDKRDFIIGDFYLIDIFSSQSNMLYGKIINKEEN